MNAARRRQGGMTIVEMVAAIAILVMITIILAQVFYQAARAAAKGKAMGEVYQVARAIETFLAKDLGGATPDFFAGGENGLPFHNVPLQGSWLMPPGPYHEALTGEPPLPPPPPLTVQQDRARRMLMGASDFLAFTTDDAWHSIEVGANDKKGALVWYVLRASGEFIRVVDPTFGIANVVNYQQAIDSAGLGGAGTDSDWYGEEANWVMAENVSRIKFSFLDRSTGAISADGLTNANGVWVDEWDWRARGYLPSAVKVELHFVDHLWKLEDDDGISNVGFDPVAMIEDADSNGIPDAVDPSETLDVDDGEPFFVIVNLPRGMSSAGG